MPGGRRLGARSLLAAVEHDDGNRTQVHARVIHVGSNKATAQRGLAVALRENPDLRQEVRLTQARSRGVTVSES